MTRLVHLVYSRLPLSVYAFSVSFVFPMPRPERRHKYITKQSALNVKAQFLSSAESGGDWKRRARDLNISRSTAYRWVFSHPRGGFRYSKVDDDIRNFVEHEIQKNPRITFGW